MSRPGNHRQSEAPRGLSRRGLLALGSMAFLSGCGFQPVYMPTASGQPGPAERELAAIRVNIIADRPGQELRQDLQERLGSDSGTEPARYNLTVGWAISGEGIGILPDTTATRIRLIGRADWYLTANNAARTRITSGSARAMDGFDVLDQQYFQANLSNEEVDRRMAASVADSIAMQLAIYFRHQAAVASR